MPGLDLSTPKISRDFALCRGGKSSVIDLEDWEHWGSMSYFLSSSVMNAAERDDI